MYCALKGVEHKFPLFKYELWKVISFQKIVWEGAERLTSFWRTLTTINSAK